MAAHGAVVLDEVARQEQEVEEIKGAVAGLEC
jgi:hypothetical protein